MRREAGYSLVEMLVALALLAMLATMMVSGVAGGRRVWERIDASTAAAETVGGAQAALRARLERIWPAARFDASVPYIDVHGEQNSLEFLAPPPDARGPASLRRYRLLLGTAGELTLVSAADVSANPDTPDDALVVVRGVRELDLAYFGAAPPDNTPRWRSSWWGQPRAPELIRVRASFQPGDRRRWPDLLVRPAANDDARCLFSTRAEVCRGTQ
ncbi:MAG TPA: prepilin-type N-terminal cleavage/methylation domain-containing protein [Caulobacteraceae bacterium]|jgi:general secretion pathway protein J